VGCFGPGAKAKILSDKKTRGRKIEKPESSMGNCIFGFESTMGE
jgi:hypothetical protein